jgi:hypothetical protein
MKFIRSSVSIFRMTWRRMISETPSSSPMNFSASFAGREKSEEDPEEERPLHHPGTECKEALGGKTHDKDVSPAVGKDLDVVMAEKDFTEAPFPGPHDD